MPCLLVFVRFHDGRYHGAGEWPPSPARLFQALVAGAAQGETLAEEDRRAFGWLETLDAPVIAAPPMRVGQSFKNYVPNNDRDTVERREFKRHRDYLAALGKIRTSKDVRPILFEAETSLLYVWTFDDAPEAHANAQRTRAIAERLYQLGRGIDMAWAWGEILDDSEAEARLAAQGALHRPSDSAGGTTLAVPLEGSLESLIERHKKMRTRFRALYESKPIKKEPNREVATGQVFVQPPKPRFRQVAYDSPPVRLLFDLVYPGGGNASWRLDRIVALTERVRDAATQRLKDKRPDEADKIHSAIVGRRDADEADKAARVCITPLGSIGQQHADHAIRRILVKIPPNCPLRADDVKWAFSGLTLDFDPETDEVSPESATLVTAADRSMLGHYGIESERTSHVWRTVTPAALPERAARRRIDPRRKSEEVKGGVERLREHDAAEWAVRQALRHAGIVAPAQTVGVQREPFESRGQRAEAFAPGKRFAKERLWHVEIAFTEPVPGPLLIGDGRYLGLGLMRPVRHMEGVFAFAIASDLAEQTDHDGLARALRRAVMARVQAQLGPRATLPIFFTGHEKSGAPARSGRHEHLGFAFDAPRKRLIILAPHILERSEASQNERKALSDLDQALDHFRELRAGAAGKLSLIPCHVDMQEDPLFARSRVWESLTPYRVTRHAKTNDPATAFETDLLAECRRGGLPRPDIEVVKTFGRSGLGLFGRARLKFRVAVEGPVLLGRDRHFGGGLFVPTV